MVPAALACAVALLPHGRAVAAPVQGALSAVAVVSAHDVWAVGNATVHWGGRGWHVLPSPTPAGAHLYGVAALSTSDVWAVGTTAEGSAGRTLIEHWNGHRWSIVPSPTPPSRFGFALRGVAAVSPVDAWAVGNDNGSGDAVIEHWDGHRWRLWPGAVGGSLSGIAVVAPRNIWITGSVIGGNGSRSPLIEHWKGQGWSPVPAIEGQRAHASAYLYATAAIAGHDVWAVGGYDDSAYGRGQGPLAAHWNGKTWRMYPVASQHNSYLSGIASIGTRDVWAVGGDVQGTLIEYWNGARWAVAPATRLGAAGAGPNALSAVAAAGSRDVWAVGSVGSDGAAQPLIAHWDGTRWRAVPIVG